jgi:molybdopterin molybdotransferase
MQEQEREPSCTDAYEPDALRVDSARARIMAAVRPITEAETVAVQDALGRVLAADLRALMDVPPHENSAVDGYALCSADLPDRGKAELMVKGKALAGHPFAARIGPGECVRIMTGAPMPPGADVVVMQEHCTAGETAILIASGHRAGENVRRAGEDLRRGEVFLARGRTLGPAELGLAASQGLAEVEVIRRPRIAVFSTGDEVRAPGVALAEGQIFDSNRYTLRALLEKLGAEVIDLGIVPDSPEALRRALEQAGADGDAVITSGGVSVGEADYIKSMLRSSGEVSFWKVAIKPGRPLAFGRLGKALFFGLPGNPVAVMVAFQQFVRPAMQRLSGAQEREPLLLRARALGRLRKRPGRMEFQRGVLSRDSDGDLVVRPWGPEGSGILRSMSDANCYIVLDHDSATVEPGQTVDVQPFEVAL